MQQEEREKKLINIIKV